jgi:hypothetical protein
MVRFDRVHAWVCAVRTTLEKGFERCPVQRRRVVRRPNLCEFDQGKEKDESVFKSVLRGPGAMSTARWAYARGGEEETDANQRSAPTERRDAHGAFHSAEHTDPSRPPLEARQRSASPRLRASRRSKKKSSYRRHTSRSSSSSSSSNRLAHAKIFGVEFGAAAFPRSPTTPSQRSSPRLSYSTPNTPLNLPCMCGVVGVCAACRHRRTTRRRAVPTTSDSGERRWGGG